MAVEVRKISLWDTLRLQWRITLPGFLQGLVASNRSVLAWRCRHGAGRATMHFLRDLREKYRCDHLWTWFPFGRTLLVFAPATMEAVLSSEANAADPFIKKAALSRFIPDALVISSGHEWRARRRFNEGVLDTGTPHRYRETFLKIVAQEAPRLTAETRDLRWPDFEALGERISHQVILGLGVVRPEMTQQLACMVRRSNFMLRDGSAFSGFYDTLGRDLARKDAAPSACLLHDSAPAASTGGASDTVRVPTQMGFWFFVLKDALELHVARTLALIAAHIDVQKRVREEIRGASGSGADAIENLRYLEGCIAEQLRLWTPVPILLRRADAPFSPADGVAIDKGRKVLIHAGFYHRDPGIFGGRANNFSPERARDGSPAPYFFSAHRQSCAGRTLVMFMLKATLAALLRERRFELVAPTIEPSRIPYLYDHFGVVLRARRDA